MGRENLITSLVCILDTMCKSSYKCKIPNFFLTYLCPLVESEINGRDYVLDRGTEGKGKQKIDLMN